METSLVRPDDRILILNQDDSFSMIVAKSDSTFRLNRQQVSVDPIIGRPYGSVFRLQGTTLVPVDTSITEQHSTLNQDFLPSVDNSCLLANNNAQKLTQDEIAELKKNLTGEQLIAVLASNSATFDSKTEFSQEKWLKKKRKQHLVEIRVVRPSALTISKMYTGKKSEKVMGIRQDTLAMILYKASLRPMSQTNLFTFAHFYYEVLVLDDCLGLVTASIAERLGGYGRVFAPFFTSSGQTADCVTSFAMSTLVAKSVIAFPLTIIGSVADALSNEQPDTHPSGVSISEYSAEESDDKSGRRIRSDQIQSWLKLGVNSLVVCVRFDIESTVDRCLPLLCGGGALVVYSPYLEPLQQYALKLRQSKQASMVQVSENWYREYQVMANRTHPLMAMHAAGGFILSAIRTIPLPDYGLDRSVSPVDKKRRIENEDNSPISTDDTLS